MDEGLLSQCQRMFLDFLGFLSSLEESLKMEDQKFGKNGGRYEKRECYGNLCG